MTEVCPVHCSPLPLFSFPILNYFADNFHYAPNFVDQIPHQTPYQIPYQTPYQTPSFPYAPFYPPNIDNSSYPSLPQPPMPNFMPPFAPFMNPFYPFSNPSQLANPLFPPGDLLVSHRRVCNPHSTHSTHYTLPYTPLISPFSTAILYDTTPRSWRCEN